MADTSEHHRQLAESARAEAEAETLPQRSRQHFACAARWEEMRRQAERLEDLQRGRKSQG